MLESAIELLQSVAKLTGIGASIRIYAAVSALHIIGIALLVGAVLPIQLALLGMNQVFPMLAVKFLRKICIAGLVICVLTGLLLLSTKPGEYLHNSVVHIKLVLVSAGILHALYAEAKISRGSTKAQALKWSAGCSFVIWLSTIGVGRWIAFSS